MAGAPAHLAHGPSGSGRLVAGHVPICDPATSQWTDELATLLIIWVAMIGASVAFIRGQHLGMDYFMGMFQIRSGLDGTLDSFSGGGLRPDDSDDGWGSVGDPDLADRTIVSRAGGQDGICLSRDPFEWSCYFPECAGRPFQAEPCILKLQCANGGQEMMSPGWVLLWSFLLFPVMNVPVAVSICLPATRLTACLAMGSLDIAAATVAQRMANRVYSFSLLAIPFFILSGLLMGRGGIARRLMDLCRSSGGSISRRAGVGECPFLHDVWRCQWVATAAVSSIGGFMIPEMERKGYGKDFSVALTITSATTGLLIPPSNIMIVYALVSGGTVSIAALFMGACFPGWFSGCCSC